MKYNWKKAAWINAKKSNKDQDLHIALCPVTEKEIYFLDNYNQKYAFESFGTCADCNLDFHVSALKMPSDFQSTPWPVEYEGVYCKDCYYKDDSDNEEKLPIINNENIEELDDGYIEEIP